jgi:hypothetical protein
MYCPICGCDVRKAPLSDVVPNGAEDAFIFIHDTEKEHTDSDLEALEYGIQ